MLTCIILLYFDEVPENIKPLLAYKPRATCHARWSPFIDFCHLDDYQKSKLIRRISVYTPSFLLIHLKPSAAEDSRITIFQRDFLLAYREIDSELADAVLKYFYEYAVQWMSPVNVALSVFAEVSPYSIEAVKTSHYPDSVDVRKLLQGRKAGLRDFFTSESRTAPSIVSPEVPVAHWKSIENNKSYWKVDRQTKRCRSKYNS